MKYQSKSAISYMFRNFWHLAPIGLFAAILMGLFCNTNAEIVFVKGVLDGTINSDNILKSILDAVSLTRFKQYWWGLLLAMLMFAISESMIFVKIERHMRVGEMLPFPLKRTFAAFPSVIFFEICVVVFSELLNFVVAGIAFLIRYASVVTLAVVSGVLLYLGRVLMMLLVDTLLLAFPIMGLESYSFNSALSYSVRLMSERRKFLALVATAYPLTVLALTVICGFIGSYAVTVVVFTLFYLLVILAIPSATFKVYYDSIGGKRQDISVVMFDK